MNNRARESWFCWIVNGNTLFPLFVIILFLTLHKFKFISLTIGKIRRFWLTHFRKRYVDYQLTFRKGACQRCGSCCNLLFSCPMLTNRDHCLIYGICRPQSCLAFPIDQRDIDDVRARGGHCGYYFPGQGFDER